VQCASQLRTIFLSLALARTQRTSRDFLQAKPDSEKFFRYYDLYFYYITVVNILSSLLLKENLKNLEKEKKERPMSVDNTVTPGCKL